MQNHSRRSRGRKDGDRRHRKEEQDGDERAKTGAAAVCVPCGTCPTMCPADELQLREGQKRLHRLEMVSGTELKRLPRADVSRTVKEYSRPAAGKDGTRPCDLRPTPVLYTTVCYLLDDVAASELQPWTEVYHFVSDRLRSVRQDMIVQRVSGRECAALLEKMVRFHLYAAYRLCGHPLRRFDPHLNSVHLQESLSWLLQCYTSGSHPHQEQFQALALLYNLGSTQTVQHILELPERIRSHRAVQSALALSRAHRERNPVRFFRLAGELDFIQTCAVHRHLLPCRRDLLLLYSRGHSSANSRYPLTRLAQLLALTEPVAARLCQSHGVKVSGPWVSFSKSDFLASPAGEEVPCQDTHAPAHHPQWNGLAERTN